MPDPRAQNALKVQTVVWLFLMATPALLFAVAWLIPQQQPPPTPELRQLLLPILGGAAGIATALSFVLPRLALRNQANAEGEPAQRLMVPFVLGNALCEGAALLLGVGHLITRSPAWLALLAIPAVGFFAHRPSRERNEEWLRALERRGP